MDQFKIEYFERDNPGKQFPCYRSLSEGEMHRIRENVAKLLGFSSVEPLDLVKEIDTREELVEGYNAERSDFRLSSVLASLNIKPQEIVYLNWYRYGQIDEMAFADIDKYLDDIWYPGPDDLDIFDASFKWILTITHDGAVQFLDLHGKED